MKKFILDKINNYIPYLENNYPIFLENSERMIEFNLNFEDVVTKFIENCEMLISKKNVQIIDSSLNDRFTESKLLESNNNVVLTNNNIMMSNNLQSNPAQSINNSQNINNITEKPNNNILISQEHESSSQNVPKTGTINSLIKEEQVVGLSKNEDNNDINTIPIRKDFSEEDSDSFLNTSDKIFLETIYSKKTKKEFTNQDFNVMDGMMLNDSDLEIFLYALEKHKYFEGKLLIVEQLLTDEVSF